MNQNKGTRELVAEDDYVTRYPEGSRFRLRVDCAHPQPNWIARQEATYTTPLHAGTAVLFEDALWEVCLAGPTERPPLRWVYYLNPWHESLPVRPPMEYSAATVTDLGRQRRLAHQREQRGHAIRFFLPLMGLLPAEDQQRLEIEYDLRARTATGLSALMILALSMAIGLWFFWASRAPNAPAWARQWSLQGMGAANYFALESLIRIWSAFSAQLPLGSLPVAGPVNLVRAVRLELDPERRRAQRHERAAASTPSSEMLEHRDAISFLDCDPPRIEVRSRLDKPHWTLNRTGVGFENAWWLPIERHPPDAKSERWRFILEQIEEDAGLPTYVDYTPTEVRRLWAAQQRQRRQSWVDTFAPALGLLGPADQERLHRVFGFDSPRYTRSSLVLTLLLGIPLATIALAHLLTGTGEPVDIGALLIGAGLTGDALRRRASASPPTASIVAPVLRRLARPLLDTPHPDEVPVDDREHPRGQAG